MDDSKKVINTQISHIYCEDETISPSPQWNVKDILHLSFKTNILLVFYSCFHFVRSFLCMLVVVFCSISISISIYSWSSLIIRVISIEWILFFAVSHIASVILMCLHKMYLDAQCFAMEKKQRRKVKNTEWHKYQIHTSHYRDYTFGSLNPILIHFAHIRPAYTSYIHTYISSSSVLCIVDTWNRVERWLLQWELSGEGGEEVERRRRRRMKRNTLTSQRNIIIKFFSSSSFLINI